MLIQIQNTEHEDIPAIFNLYDEAISYQKKLEIITGLALRSRLLKKKLDEKRHYKILLDGKIGSTFIIIFSDKLICKFAKDEPAIYLHRIATSEASRGNDLLKHIIEWAKNYARQNQLSFIRMDTGSANDRLINYYIRCGFTVTDKNTKVDNAPELPAHYENGIFTLLEMAVNPLE